MTTKKGLIFKNRGLIKLANMADISKHYFQFNMPDGNIKSKTCTGGIVTLLLVIILVAFAAQNLIMLWNRSNYRILEQSKVRELTHSQFKFGKKDGFILAAAFVGVGQITEEDPEIGQMKFLIKSW